MPTTLFMDSLSILRVFVMATCCSWISIVRALDVPPLESYADAFVNPDVVLANHFNSTTSLAQNSIQSWATQLAAQGPWAVTNKSVLPPSGDIHDYMSWAPYSFPNCTGVGNTTQLTDQQIWVTCPYYIQDGVFNPDVRTLVDDTGQFSSLADAVLYNSLAWVLSNHSSTYSSNVANFINTWFIAPATKMNPNLVYAQMNRGPNGQMGTHTGILDLKCMAEIASGILILRKGNCAEWTPQLDSAMNAWTNTYISWLESFPTAVEEGQATNNHGSFYYAQLASLKVLVGDMTGAQNVTRTYFSNQYMSQIAANGEQPLEAARTRPYHYRSYNLAAMITNARLANYTGYNVWSKPTTSGSTIQTALDFALTVPPGDEAADELYPNVAAVGAAYGDPTGQYAAFLKGKDGGYPEKPYFFWYQPFSDSGLAAVLGSSAGSPQPTGTSGAVHSVLGVSKSVWGVVVTTILWFGLC